MLSFLRRRSAVAVEAPPGPALATAVESVPLSELTRQLREAGKDPFELQFLARDIRRRRDEGEDAGDLEARFQRIASARLLQLGAIAEGEEVVVVDDA